MTRLRMWLRSVFFSSRLEREMREEMQLHLDRTAKRLEGEGLSPEDARAGARREFGNAASIQEEGRDARGCRGLETVLGDCRYALRHFRRTPLTAATMVAIFALGIGFNTVFFAILHSFTTGTPA